MRSLVLPEPADIVVSELLGSFGDNELSPECLDGAMRFLKRRSLLILFSRRGRARPTLPSFMVSLLSPLLHSLLF